MTFLLRRAARIAASLTRFARSAPEKPGDWRATPSTSTPLSSGLPLVWTRRIAVAAVHVGPVEDDLAVEAARAQQRRVEDVGPVGGGDDDHVGVGVEAVHLDQDLVERLLALVVAAAEAGAALAADRVDLVDEDDAGRVALGLVEQVAHAAGADADEHLDELGARDAEERHAGLAGDGAGQQGLAGAGRADQQHAARDARAERVELLRVLQELDDFLELRLGLVDAGDVVERHDRLVAEEHPGAALAEAEGLVIGALGLAHHEEDEAADHEERQQPGEQQAEPRRVGDGLRLVDVGGELLGGGGRDHVRPDVGQAGDAGHDDRDDLLVGARHRQGVALLDDLLDRAGRDVIQELGIADGRRRCAGRDPGEQQRGRAQHQHDHHDAVPEELGVQRGSLRGYGRRRCAAARPSIAPGRRTTLGRRSWSRSRIRTTGPGGWWRASG